MPSFIVHGFIGYLVYGKMGFYLGILPDLIGFSYYFLRVSIDYLTGDSGPTTELIDQASPKAGLKYICASSAIDKSIWFEYSFKISTVNLLPTTPGIRSLISFFFS